MVQLASHSTLRSSAASVASLSSVIGVIYSALPLSVGLAGASSTFLQAGGRSASVIGLAGGPGGFGLGCRTLSENQYSSDLALQPSSPGTGGCLRQFGESAGHFSRTWM